MLGESALLCKFLCGKAHTLCKGLKERAAAGGAGLVEHDGVDCAVCNAEAFDVLTADVENEVDLRVEVLCRREVRNRFDDAEVDSEGALDQLLTVACNGRAAKRDAITAEGLDLFQLRADDLHGIALIGGVILI